MAEFVGIRTVRTLDANQTVTNSVVAVAVPAFTVALRPQQRFVCRITGFATTAAAEGLRILFSVPAAPAIYQLWALLKETATANTLFARDLVASAEIAVTDDITAFTATFHHLNGINAGNFEFRFAQSVAGAGNTVLLAGSRMELIQLFDGN